ncbi:GGDEF domain-containing protein [Cohnella silvisoli]|uniref:GGDEF domain-containing protein n=1 Tax=Cohnella silvisoli TaxID=2873699 RepID=A0ABV1KQF7_9BACL|nr:GGDEF domain-containing protein [Cohnella silvisoli]MCD9022084.1 GGDEF domain-containing protein [Cohnella silvisoli]
MNYRGRILTLQIAVAISVLLFADYYLEQDYTVVALTCMSVIYAFTSWSLGKKYDQAKYNSENDALTEVYNRRYALQIFPKLKLSADRKSEKVMVFVLDIDNFKSINEKHDHEMGDLVLRQVANVLTDSFRNTDYVIRWGGDEFLVIMPRVDEKTITLLYSNLENRLSHISSYTSIEISVSLGYSVYPDEGNRLDDLIKISDRKMFSEKKNKPNRRNQEDAAQPVQEVQL